jgi:tetratricopeptide (TPR) repeat protein
MDDFKDVLSKADAGDPDAQFSAGSMLLNRENSEKNTQRAIDYFRLSAEQGNVKAQFNLAMLLYNHVTIPQDLLESFRWAKQASLQGDSRAQCLFGVMHEEGKSVEKDLDEAKKWFEVAAERGEVQAQYRLGRLLKIAENRNQDIVSARKWLQIASEQGLADAQFHLGGMYQNGQGGLKDLNEARKWLQKAADQGHEIAKMSLEILPSPFGTKEVVVVSQLDSAEENDLREELVKILAGIKSDGLSAETLEPFMPMVEKYGERDWSICYTLGICFITLDIPKSAFDFIENATKLKPDDRISFLYLGKTHMNLGDYEKAISTLKESLALAPCEDSYSQNVRDFNCLFGIYYDEYEAVNGIALSYRSLNQFEQAINWYEELKKILFNRIHEKIESSSKPSHRDDVIDGKKVRVILPEMFDQNEEIIRSDPSYTMLMNGLGICYYNLEDYEVARDCFQTAIEFKPDDFELPNLQKKLKQVLAKL